ncbi:hypothetical protein BH23GEM2_BH23GEM2_24260 [soil metagenome]
MSAGAANQTAADQRRVFPWGSNNPSRRQRVILAMCVAVIAMAGLWWQNHLRGGYRTDFGMIWFGARTMLAGGNPYELVGPGLQFEWMYLLLYPGTALVAGIPFA